MLEGSDDLALASRLANGDATALEALIDRHHPSMIRFARGWVSEAVAEEVVQEAWLAILEGIGQFEGRASLKSWIFRIVLRTAMARAKKEGRSVPLSSLEPEDEPSVPSDRFLPPEHPRWAGHWSAPPDPWDSVPEHRFIAAETNHAIEQAIETLPPAQRQVIRLRDVEGWTGEEVCTLLEISEANQRVLLHRARARVRASLVQHLGVER